MGAFNCGPCGGKLKEQYEDKPEDERTEDEQQFLDNYDEDNPGDATPFAFGPLSSWNGDYCTTCHTAGQVLAALTGGVAGWVSTSQLGFSGLEAGALGVLTWLILAGIVGFLGRYPLVGAIFGPIVERMLANGKEDNSSEETPTAAADGGTEVMDSSSYELPDEPDRFEPDDSTTIPEEAFEKKEDENDKLRRQNREFRDRIDTLQEEVIEPLRDQKSDKDSEIRNKEETISELQSKIDSLEDENEELEKELDDIEAKVGFASKPGTKVGKDMKTIVVEDPNKDSLVGPFFAPENPYAKVEHPEHPHGTYIPIGHRNPEKAAKFLVNRGRPEKISKEEIPDYKEFMIIEPEDLDSPITFPDRDHEKYDPEDDVALFLGSVSDAQSLDEMSSTDPDADFTNAVLRLGVDMNGQPVDEGYDDSGKPRKLENEKQRFEHQFHKQKNISERRKSRMKDLMHELDLRNDTIDDLEERLEWMKNRENRSLKATRRMTDTRRVARDRADVQEEELERTRRERDAAIEGKREERARRYREDTEYGREKEEAENRREAESDIDRAFQEAKKHYEGEADLRKVENDPDYEHDKKDIINDVMNDPEIDGEIVDNVRDKLLGYSE